MMTPEETKVGAGPSQADASPVGGSEPGLRAWGGNKVGSGEMKCPAAGTAAHHVPMLYGEPMAE
ncbi:MAG: hypothetical protein Q8N33_13680, partial [Rhodocyclaceae bacterium]|nr:hypothetical protein [Rhodocyclaceae bacterium]